jgi:signal transduction histidine kinase
VADSGPGIAEAHYARLFERFYRADASRNRTTGGAGLGLAICKSIVGAHHGAICVEPSPPPGITFAFRLPRAAVAEKRL